MKCREVRDILSGAMDCREEPRASLAMEHTGSCPECAEWLRGALAAHETLQSAKLTIPGVDMSGAIMASLPARHPASCRATRTFAGRKLIALMAACWLLGAAMMAAGVGLWTHYYGGSPHAVAASAEASVGAAGSVARSAWETCSLLYSLFLATTLGTLVREARGIVTFLILDILVLVLAAVIWRRRRALSGLFCILS